jgi:hypothetical protein
MYTEGHPYQQNRVLASFVAVGTLPLLTAHYHLPRPQVCLVLADAALYAYVNARFWLEYERVKLSYRSLQLVAR